MSKMSKGFKWRYKNKSAKYNLSKRSGGKNAIKYICVHYTGGTGSAKNNVLYFASGNRSASADFFIDDSGVYKFNPNVKKYYSWAVGDGHGKYGITNSNSISIEVVNNGGKFSDKGIAYLTKLVKWAMKYYGVKADHVVRHYDASRKRCPVYYCGSDAADKRWKTLHKKITGKE